MRIFAYLLAGACVGVLSAIAVSIVMPRPRVEIIEVAKDEGPAVPPMTPAQLRGDEPAGETARPAYVIPAAQNDVQAERKDEPKGLGGHWVKDDTPSTPLWVDGRGWGRGRWFVWLSDGRVIREGDPVIERIDDRGVVLADGRRVWMRPVRGSDREVNDFTADNAEDTEEPPAPGTSGDDPLPSAEGDVTALAPPRVRTAPRT